MDSSGLNGNQSTRDSEVPDNADERCDATFSDELDGWRTSSSSLKDIRSSDEHTDECLTPEMKYESTHRSSSPPPQARRGLEHCITAPVTIGGGLFPEGQDMAFSRSLTERRVSPRHNVILDRLSERGKQKLIAELVKIQGDGTVEVDLTKSTPETSELLELRSVEEPTLTVDRIITDFNKSVPKLKIVVLIVGTRGDVQPFLAMAKRLQAFGHHVRLATHSNFRDFVKSGGIDYYPLGGDPRVLAGYMARNKGLIPSGPGEISVQRKQLKAIIESLLPACTEPDIETGEPFRAQAIIANPPAYGHAHVAEALGVPLHIFFTMPWTPTSEFPHPMARVPQPAAYWLSYILVDLLVWWGIRGYINDFRKKKLNLPPIAYFSTYHGSISHFPTGYMWSPHVVPKPKDWGSLVDIVGYCFLNLGRNYQPPEEFIKWIQNGPKPVYIGFGSMPLEDTIKTTDIILEALRNTGQRGILDRGWGDLGTFQEIPEDVFLVAEYPHDWLFPQCAAVVHHGGAGTTAAGLRAGCPTTIVPFFGDQFFWGDRIHEKGLGPAPIPIDKLSVEGLSDAITFMLQPDVKSRVMELAVLLENEDGVAGAVDAFHRHLPSEMPLPTPTPAYEDIDGPNPLQWLFTRIGRICCLPCGS
ncbi:sterol 3-beta-glucosyltransferase UGT80B1 [Solanum pennellii]|uniref:Sterol 3-beta-glucosyltransferase UGT80B1 n=1 Tax=Solanum pennellii TaxID=28526 RepID=A0ABM1GI67_SOLPN|nr:sterol 3-beta-glucosyltransferase UGT80B1 [Solanum pennellii]XP_015071404.1 sterol 3-beta-glucosyltransferase UGT80B1 [Solanum pennellii]XP_015071405.1 sterol 3-beta-glucosyltransferase UGT80B1 [Solanum pennellii]XP_015071406.1 sterol 3-beta-glucosyltransferase UGT80B1 [Solanum pennellii]XP_015071407.1 sterol 3-beta-glucosyltransferase UGT80B1 [Solanum pennellii]